ncbi:MAG: FAD/NAD(P)-binding protein [Acetobacteraceae bacterium]|nr:FAD/NAD(P)-binding protein [Acetobacteraceae bacterium]
MSRHAANPLKPEPAVIKAIRQETYDTTTYTMGFREGERANRFSFEPGQFNMLTLWGIGEAAISLSSLPGGNGTFDHTVRSVGDVTNALRRLKVGDTVWARGPYGTPWPLKEARGRDLLIIAGGIGLAPLRGVIQAVTSRRSDFGKAELLYGARTPADLLYTTEFDDWRRGGLSLTLTVDAVPEGARWEHNVGVVTTVMDRATVRPGGGVVMVCGPEIMMKFVVKELLARGFRPGEIFVSLERRMECGVRVCGRCQFDGRFVCRDGPVLPYSDIKGRVGTML